MAEVTQSVEVDVPVTTAYNQWTQFEEFPTFMENVESVKQIDDTHLQWVAEIAGNREEWTAEITRQQPDREIAWESIGGKGTSGVVRFDQLGDNRTRVQVTMSWEPEGFMQSLGEKLGGDSLGVKRDLENFKEVMESRGTESGAWRGEVQQGERTR